jgi:hypothetical protein
MNGSPLRILSVIILPAAISYAGVRIDFNRSNQTYDWLTEVDYNIRRDGFTFGSSFNGQSNLVKSVSRRWQENAIAGIMAEKTILPRLSFVASAQYDVSGLDKRRVRSSTLSAGVAYHPIDSLEIRPLANLTRIKRSDLDRLQNDQGAGIGLDISLGVTKISRINLSGNAAMINSRLTNIPSNEIRGALNAAARITDMDTFWVSLQGLEAAKKYYGLTGLALSISKQIKQERRTVFGAMLSLPANFKIHAGGNAHLSRYLYRNGNEPGSTAPQRDNYGRGGGYKLSILNDSGRWGNAAVGYAWNRASQDFQGLLLDQDAELGELSFRGMVRLSTRDSLAADIMIGVTSYTNPNIGSQNQDRDQKSIVFSSRFSHVFSKYFSAGITGGANSFHQIYVSGVQSANNSRNDTYIISHFARWILADRLTVTQTFEIQANYITFDFDRKQLATRNRIFRRATAQTDFKFTVTPKLAWQQAFVYRYEDYGQLLWNEGWQQAVSWDRRKGGFETRFVYAPNKIIQFSPAFGWEKTNDYSHAVELDVVDNLPREVRYVSDEQVKLSYGAELIFNWHPARRLRIDMSHRIREFAARPREINDYATLTLEYLF